MRSADGGLWCGLLVLRRASRELCEIRAHACVPGALRNSSPRVRSRSFANFEPTRAFREPCEIRAHACVLGTLRNSSARVRSGNFAKLEPTRALWELCEIRVHACALGTWRKLSPRVHSWSFARFEPTRALGASTQRIPDDGHGQRSSFGWSFSVSRIDADAALIQ